ncbi:MAG: hypothetical protein AAFY83_05750 [Pseudomonadota bacterium]
MRAASMLKRSVCLLVLMSLGVLAASAQTAPLITGKVFNSFSQAGAIVIELSEPNNCGSNNYISGTDSTSRQSVQDAIDGAAEIDGVVTIRHGACTSTNAMIDGIAYGPDV